MVISSDKSIVVSGLKHGSTNVSLIALDYVQEFFPTLSNTFSRQLFYKEAPRLDNISRLVYSHYQIGQSFDQFFSSIRKNQLSKYHTITQKFYEDIFKNLFGHNENPIFILIKNPDRSFISAFAEDFSEVLFKRKKVITGIYPSFYQYYTSNNYHKNNLIEFLSSADEESINLVVAQSLKLFGEDIVKGHHLNTLHLTRAVLFLSILSEYFPETLKRTFIIDLDSYDTKLIPFLRESKVLINSSKGKLVLSNSNSSLVDMLLPYLPSDMRSLPLGKIRLETERSMHGFIISCYKDNFLSEFNLPTGWKFE
jgi:hypothetical protein